MLIDKGFEFVNECLGKDCSGHDVEHIKRVYENALRILEQEEADREVVLLSAVLHDVDDYKLGGDGKNLARFFEKYGVDEILRRKVREVIENIGFSKSGDRPKFCSIEQKIVSDADKLDAMGAIGVCRTVMYSAVCQRALFDENELPDKNLSIEEYKKKDRKGNHSINHFFDKLLKLKGAMQTDCGKRLAEERHKFMLAFLREFFYEVNAKAEWEELLKDFE